MPVLMTRRQRWRRVKVDCDGGAWKFQLLGKKCADCFYKHHKVTFLRLHFEVVFYLTGNGAKAIQCNVIMNPKFSPPPTTVNECHLDLQPPQSNWQFWGQLLTNGNIFPICFSAACAYPDNDMVNLKWIANRPHFICRGGGGALLPWRAGSVL